MPRPVLPAVALLLMIPGTSRADAPGATDTVVADPAALVESPPTQATENRVAFAGPPGTAEVQVPPPAEAPVAPTGLIALRDADAAAGRAFLTPTAITGRKGSARVDFWFPTLPIVGFATATYSVTNRIELGVGAMWVPDQGDSSAYALRAKWAPIRVARGGVAVELQHLSIPDEEDSLTLVTAVGSHCLDRACRFLASVSLTAIPESNTYDSDNDSFGDALHVVGGASLVAGDRIKFVADLVTIDDSYERVFAGYAGVRLARAHWSVDAGLVGGGEGDDGEVVPLPLIGATARW